MTPSDGPGTNRTSAPPGAGPPQSPGVAANERLTALAGAVLLVLILVELATLPDLGAMLSLHVFAGVVLAGPLVLKLASTGYRFARYYTRSPAYVRRGTPPLPLRLLAPMLVVTTLVVIGSGIGLLVAGPGPPGALQILHGVSSVAWLPMLAAHLLGHVRDLPRLIAEEWRRRPPERTSGRWLHSGLNLALLAGGALAAILMRPLAASWMAWIRATGNIPGPLFLVVGLGLAVLAVIAGLPLLRRA